MFSRYFAAGNLWTVFAVLTFMGQKKEQSSPEMYSFFGVGRWFSPNEYNLLIVTMILAAAVCFGLQFMCGRACSNKDELAN